MIVVFDIDGTLADNKHRAHLIEGPKKDWDKFYDPQLVAKDPLIEGTKEILFFMQELKYQIIFLTGRPESLRMTTEAWLKEHLNITVSEETLLMRANGNFTKARDYKREQLTDLRSRNAMHNSCFIFVDDDWRNRDMYVEFGLFFHAPEFFRHANALEPKDLE